MMKIGEYISSRTRAAAEERAAAREEIDARKAVVGEICGDPEMDADGAATFRAAIDLAAQALDDEKAVEVQCLYPDFAVGAAYAAGARLVYDGKLYKVLQAHTSQADWTPPTAPSLFSEVLPGQSGTGIGEWQQPDSTNPYKRGDKVTHNGKTWESTADNNVWEPGVYGWAEA